jgi:hypothetical protein
LLHVALHLFEERLRPCRIAVHQASRKLQVGRESDKMLLHALVKFALNPAAVGVAGHGEPLPGFAQARNLAAQPVELP